MRVNQIAAELGQVHEILGQGAASSEKRVLESDGSFIVIAVLGNAEGGAGGGVGYRGCPSGIGYVLHDLIGASSGVREQFCCHSVWPWNGWVCVVSHLWHWGAKQVLVCS